MNHKEAKKLMVECLNDAGEMGFIDTEMATGRALVAVELFRARAKINYVCT